MIPTMLLLGLIAGLAFRTWWSIPVLGVAWSAELALDPALGTSVIAGAFLFGAANAAIGVALGRLLRRVVSARRAGA